MAFDDAWHGGFWIAALARALPSSGELDLLWVVLPLKGALGLSVRLDIRVSCERVIRPLEIA